MSRGLLPALGLAALLAAGAAQAIGVHDPGAAALEGTATDLVERRVVLDLWDAGQAARNYTLRLAPDGDALPGAEARVRPLRGAEAAWGPLEGLRLAAGPDKRASDRGWDGLYELGLRVRLPAAAEATLAVLVVEEAPGVEALALTTTLRAAPLHLLATVEQGPDGPVVRAWIEGPKVPLRVEAAHGPARWALAPGPDGWRLPWPAGAPALALAAAFRDGAVLPGPRLAPPPAQASAPDAPGPGPHVLPGGPAIPGEASEPVAAAGPSEAAPGPILRPAPDGDDAAEPAPPPRPVPGLPISLAAAAVALVSRGKRAVPPRL